MNKPKQLHTNIQQASVTPTLMEMRTLQVGNTKSVDGKMTFTHFLAEMVETKFSGIDGFENELSHAAEACRGS